MSGDPVADALVDIVDEEDRVVGQATRAEMRRRGLRHRAVYVLVRTTADEIVVHRRADWKDVYPGAWDICFGGVLDAGEGWDAAAERELAEEAGITAELRPVHEGAWSDGHTAIVGRVYEAVHDGPYPCPDGEVVEVRTVSRAALDAFLAGHPHCPDTVALLQPWLSCMMPPDRG